MVFHDRPVYQEEHAAQLIVARRICLHRKAEYICADLSIDPSLFPCSQTANHTFSEPRNVTCTIRRLHVHVKCAPSTSDLAILLQVTMAKHRRNRLLREKLASALDKPRIQRLFFAAFFIYGVLYLRRKVNMKVMNYSI